MTLTKGTVNTVLLVLAIICFVIEFMKFPIIARYSFMNLGFAFVTASLLV